MKDFGNTSIYFLKILSKYKDKILILRKFEEA